jgi:hypothetical protein
MNIYIVISSVHRQAGREYFCKGRRMRETKGNIIDFFKMSSPEESNLFTLTLV